MQSAEAATPAPTYGMSASSRSPCTVPSSPNGPWRIGSTTSTSPSEASGPPPAGTGSVSATVSASPPGPSSQRPSRPIAIARTS